MPAGLRVVSYNVMRFSKSNQTVLAISAALAQLAPQLVCLNEVDLTQPEGGLQTLADRLEASVHFFGHVGGRYGNAVLSRLPVLSVEQHRLDGGSVVPGKAGEPYRIARGLLVLEVGLSGGGRARVGCTHLDHMARDQREVQLRHCVSLLGQSPADAVLLVGDLNALTRADYSPEQWERLEQRAASRGWSPPSAGELDILIQAGYADAAAEGAKLTAHELYRIDYCYHRGAGLAVKGATVAQDVKLSDHCPLVVDFEETNLRCNL